MTYIVFGASGMLGREVVRELHMRGLVVAEPSHSQYPINDRTKVEEALAPYGALDTIINCAGSIAGDGVEMTLTNALGPQVLGAVAVAQGCRLLHVSTDCVFSGKAGPYRVTDRPDAENDVYGRSKMVGEGIAVYSRDIMIVRTSFIGFRHGLLHWFIAEARANRRHRIKGWAGALWSGSTVWAVASGIVGLVERWPAGGVHHLATPEPISKYDLLAAVSQALGLNANLQRVTKPVINRTLVPTTKLDPVLVQLSDLRERYNALYMPPHVFAGR